ncbi:unnamed protein product [Owenia fusiformis]|uniref:Uncharacterized protein n=1 Tax=Owenia fusiformis TaxID=6347 RepID=A0A8J1THV8_OWEFU|nr:unnamed protein product [Owenia fusiformis]
MDAPKEAEKDPAFLKLANNVTLVKNHIRKHRGSIISHQTSGRKDTSPRESFDAREKLLRGMRTLRFGSAISEVLKLDELKNSTPPSQVRFKRKKLKDIVKKMTEQKIVTEETSDHVELTPYQRLRQKAKAVLLMIKVFKACQDFMSDEVSRENWYNMADNITGTIDISPNRNRAFMTFVPNDKHELEQLTFDVYQFKRDHKAENVLTDQIRNILRSPFEKRTSEQINETLMCMKKLSDKFNSYPLDVQRKLCTHAQYIHMYPNRVILKKGHFPDGVYVVLSGMLIEKSEDDKKPVELRPSDIFGEDDLKCGSPRRVTVVTKAITELFYVHRIDYHNIFYTAPDADNPKNLDICKRDIVFQHFNMQKLVDNPNTWSVMSYKFGSLIARDSNAVEFIYVLKSGEARVIMYLDGTNVDMKAQRRRLKANTNAQCPYNRKRQILSFEEERDFTKSAYKVGQYNPGTICPQSAPAGAQREHHQGCMSPTLRTYSSPPTRSVNKLAHILTPKPLEDDIVIKIDTESDDSDETDDDDTDEPLNTERAIEQMAEANEPEDYTNEDTAETTGYIETGKGGDHRGNDGKSRQKRKSKINISPISNSESKITVPPFVQLESLHAGQIFGLRSCLDPEERGPSVSLVSGGCEVVQINKRFFMKHIDESIYSLIRLKFKPFPSQQEMIDRLSTNFEWQEFKQDMIGDFIRSKTKPDRSSYTNTT